MDSTLATTSTIPVLSNTDGDSLEDTSDIGEYFGFQDAQGHCVRWFNNAEQLWLCICNSGWR
jgi:hypothetical protein